MISQDIVEQAIAIATELDSRGLILTAVSGSPLDELNKSASLTAPVNAMPSSGNYTPDARYIEAESGGWGQGVPSKHDTALRDMTDVISKAVSSHLLFAKSVVRPVVQSLVEEMEADIAALPVSAEYSLKLVVLDPPEPMIAASFEASVEEFKDVAYMPLSGYVALGERTPQEILELMHTGDSDTDASIVNWSAKMGDAFFQRVWNTVFTSEPTTESLNTLCSDRATGDEAALVVFLLTKRLYDNPPEGTALSLTAYNTAIADIRNQMGLRLHHTYERYARDTKTQLLIARYNATEVFVNGNVYRKWIEGGGNNALLFGSLLTDRPARFVNDLNEQKAGLLKAWEQHNYILTVSERNNRFVRYKAILHARLTHVVGSQLQECFAHLRAGGIPADTTMPEYQQFLKNADCFVDTLIEGDFKNVWSLALKAVCRCAFYYTEAEKILGGIEKACSENEGIDVREAALLSLIEYVVDYVCDQLSLTGI